MAAAPDLQPVCPAGPSLRLESPRHRKSATSESGQGCRLARCSKTAAIWGTPAIPSMSSSRQPVTQSGSQPLTCPKRA
jgi:hypothetical protein